MEAKNNSGAIFKNDKKTAETHPDYKGKIIVDGAEKQIALWLKTSQSGLKFFSVAISEPYKKAEAVQPESTESPDLPF